MSHSLIRHWLEQHSPVEPSLLEGVGIDAIVTERINAFGGSEPAYLAELSRSPDEVDRLMAGIAVPETWLFRYPRSYEVLLEFAQLRLAAKAATFRMLSVGCATGQEPYCMAMTALRAGWTAERVRVEGLDRNREFLRLAEVGEYGAGSIRAELPSWAMRYLQRCGDVIRIDASAREPVRFLRADITELAGVRGEGAYDVIFCRNVLIYLNAESRTRLLDSICAELAPGGLLFVGHAEQLMRGSTPLGNLHVPHAFALERPSLPRATGRLSGLEHPQQSRVRVPVAYDWPPARVATGAIPAPRKAPEVTIESSMERAQDLADGGRLDDAEKMIRAIILRSGPTAPAMELLGVIRVSVNDTEGAKRLFEQAVYLEPTRVTSLLQLALLSERAGAANSADAYWARTRRASQVSEKGRTQ